MLGELKANNVTGKLVLLLHYVIDDKIILENIFC